MNNQQKPLVSIGMPVYNGEKLIRNAIDSILAQDYPNMEFIISDNASTDTTESICREYAAKVKWIKYIRNPVDIGMCANFNQVCHLSKGKYFMWAAHDDMWDKTYIRKCVTKLENIPQAIACVSDTVNIDDYGNHLGSPAFMETINLSVPERVAKWLSAQEAYQIYGVYRSESLKKTSLLLDTFGPDVILAFEILLLGETVKVNEKLFYYRIPTIARDLIKYARELTPDPSKQQNITHLSFSRLTRELYLAVERSVLENNIKHEVKKILVENIINDVNNIFLFRKNILIEHDWLFNSGFLLPSQANEFIKLLITTGFDYYNIKHKIENKNI